MNFHMFKLDLEKAQEPEIKTANICRIIEKAREFQKNIYFCFIDYAKPLTMQITTNCGKFLKRWEYQTTLSASQETCMQVKKQQLEPGMEQWIGSKLGKGYVKAVYFHPAYLTSIEYIMWCVRLDKAQAGIKIAGEISVSDMQLISL